MHSLRKNNGSVILIVPMKRGLRDRV